MANPNRIQSIDLLRGAVMIIMALDHTRDFFHWKAFTDDPMNLATTSPALFMTRWVTHFCAPVFVFLSGSSIFLQSLRKPKPQLRFFLLTRGLWLLIAEFLIINFAFSFDIYFTGIVFQVIGAIGISMILLSLLIWLPYPVLLLLGIIIVFGHNAIDHPVLKPMNIPLGANHTLFIFYPFIPWTGIMILGFCAGKIINNNKKLAWVGTAATSLFVALRWLNIYGDPQEWSYQKNSLYTFFSFIDVEKYPPSLLYTCMTLGPALLLLSRMSSWRGKIANVIITYGQVPFFYYILHFYLLHILCTLFFFLRGHSFYEGYHSSSPFKFLNLGEGYSLGVVYLVWIAVVVALYPLCKWYAAYKRSHHQWWLGYL